MRNKLFCIMLLVIAISIFSSCNSRFKLNEWDRSDKYENFDRIKAHFAIRHVLFLMDVIGEPGEAEKEFDEGYFGHPGYMSIEESNAMMIGWYKQAYRLFRNGSRADEAGRRLRADLMQIPMKFRVRKAVWLKEGYYINPAYSQCLIAANEIVEMDDEQILEEYLNDISYDTWGLIIYEIMASADQYYKGSEIY